MKNKSLSYVEGKRLGFETKNYKPQSTIIKKSNSPEKFNFGEGYVSTFFITSPIRFKTKKSCKKYSDLIKRILQSQFIIKSNIVFIE